jgi:uncharacterized membrane protein
LPSPQAAVTSSALVKTIAASRRRMEVSIRGVGLYGDRTTVLSVNVEVAATSVKTLTPGRLDT